AVPTLTERWDTNKAVSNAPGSPRLPPTLPPAGTFCYGDEGSPQAPFLQKVVMATDPYASCPCGSGKKFKWCCQPIYAGINQALEQAAHGQHETALRIIDSLARDHADNPEVWGQKARLLYAHDKTEEADEALQKAFD